MHLDEWVEIGLLLAGVALILVYRSTISELVWRVRDRGRAWRIVGAAIFVVGAIVLFAHFYLGLWGR